jgi:hypothetical protein
MRFVTGLLAVGIALMLHAAPAAAQPSFDGQWIAELPPLPAPCNGTRTMKMVVIGSDLAGTVDAPWNRNPTSFTGKIDSDGTGLIDMQGAHGTVRFSGDRFQITWIGGRCGSETAMGDRGPDPSLTQAMMEKRQQSQKSFAELAAAADRGDKIDYTALRTAYPYTNAWDPYGNKSNLLMQQAEAAQKGGDCDTALDYLDQILKADFTIDGAHALRADCLQDDPQKAAIENAIADGLVHSLMDSGDGASEKTAYVVNTAREETDVLANRHIQLKTRKINLRGKDGRYYDLIQGVILGDTPSAGSAQTTSVYFDVSAFVEGRLSRDIQISTIAAAIH